jgi:hypothetical protein
MKNKTCCFTGHRKIPRNLKTKLSMCLKIEIEKLIKNGGIYFRKF